ncbi:hypothetical protein P168DRAFT_323629 [Aspergillus campestris IBT 28561]|uniref:Uncharacterized protein n=1 Tax=Aspergillus campestris (strain IBT 28561) TaxID=1392248 RepID=A0A2I1DF72_ASPC2|nr:uncharacterized protein P168DRAFT_323629 [Aspergillus campestris IBT 28561]PKY08511.1 hypothetical protein P168DRAFT_323629 [Aspergillus campestris IBT 28561]
MQQFKNWGRQSQRRPSQPPILTPEDEAFLRTITSEDTRQPPVSPPTEEAPANRDVQTPISPVEPVAGKIQPSVSPGEEFGRELGEEERRKTLEKEEAEQKAKATPKDRRASHVPAGSSKTDKPPVEKKLNPLSWFRRKSPEKKKSEPEKNATTDIPKNAPVDSAADAEVKQETEDMTEILERLNLAADNNNVFSFSDETQELLRKFTLIFKDLINGVPTAYHDLEMLLTNGNRQLQSTYSQLPGFLQKLIEKLPEKWTDTLAPEILAVAGERAAKSGMNIENVGKAAAAANKMGIQVPSLKELVGKPAAVVGMLRSIVAFLRARFPAVLGMNALWSLALFILLFVLWYCHKRGREVRLENERLVTEEEIGKMNEDSPEERIRATQTLTTTAPQGASAAEIRDGIKQAQEARQTPQETASTPAESSQKKEKENEAPDTPAKPTRSKSRLSIFGRPHPKPALDPKDVQPYPGT